MNTSSAVQDPRALLPQARTYAQRGEIDRATETLAALLKAIPDHAEAIALFYDLCAADKTLSIIDRFIAADPKSPGLHSVAAGLCRKRGAHARELAHLEALARLGAYGEVFSIDYGASLCRNGQYERALEVSRKALSDSPTSFGLHQLQAQIYRALGQYDASIKAWSEAARLAPENPLPRGAVGTIKLLTTGCKEGFEEYAAHREWDIKKYGIRPFSIPEWKGGKLDGKRLLIWSTQGIGDIVMFSSFLPWVLSQGTQVTLTLYPKLIPLFARSFPEVRLVPFALDTLKDTLPGAAKDCDAETILGQLMAYGLPHYTPADHLPYLKADAELAGRLREKYLALKPGVKKLVGISWFSSNADNASQRNIPLMDWQPLFSLPQVQLVSLQYGDHAAEIEAVNQQFPSAVYADPDIDAFENIDGLAAQMTAMDEVVSIQNTTAHLSGALGVKTTLMLSTASDWRWGLSAIRSRWYHSIYIERQKQPLDWRPVLNRVCERIQIL